MAEKEKRTGTKKGRAVFVTSLCVSMVILSALFLLFMLYTKTLEAEAPKRDVPVKYTTGPEENLSCVLFGCKEAADEPGLILLLSYRAAAGTLDVLLLPPETLCEVNGRTDTLAGHYDYEGVRGGRNGLRSLLNLSELRYLRADGEGISALADFLGGVEYELPADCVIGGEQFWKGRQLLDGPRLEAILFAENSYRCVDTARQTEMTGLLLERGLNAGLAERYDRLQKMVFSTCEADLSQYDFLLRKQRFCDLLIDGGLKLQVQTLEGEYSPGGMRFTPDPVSVSALKEIFGG